MPNNDNGNGRCGFVASNIDEAIDADGNGHGTHVAGTICGTTYGVADCEDLCAVKVLSAGGSGSWSGVIAGINHVINNCAGIEKECVINMSLGGGFSQSINDAVAAAADAGIVVVVAAGNSNANACNYSPASEPKAITVGSTTNTDARSSFSNFGDCVDVYDPGSGITSAWIGSTSATRTISGTSMASPHEFVASRTPSRTGRGGPARALPLTFPSSFLPPPSPQTLPASPRACSPRGKLPTPFPPTSRTPPKSSTLTKAPCPSPPR